MQSPKLLYCTNMSANGKDRKGQRFRVYSASTLGAAIRHYRNALGISQTELAARTGMPRNYVNALENGLETEQLKRTLAVLRELGVRMTLDREDW
jgi:DNA-binding XRE family transcriptional regulator